MAVVELRQLHGGRRARACVARLGVGLLLGACGGGSAGSEPPSAPRAARDAETEAAPHQEVAALAEIGALDERAAEASFRASLDGLQACVSDGVERLEFMGGSIEFAVKVDAQQRPARIWAAESSLGERATEKCMFEALRAVSWPAPQGGIYGIARSSFEFEPRKGAPRPAIWDAGRVSKVVDDLHDTLSACGGGRVHDMHITLYIGADGRAVAGGAAYDEASDDGAVDCVVDALLAERYPRPERTPTKVRFRL
jgi:hypothetical protein